MLSVYLFSFLFLSLSLLVSSLPPSPPGYPVWPPFFSMAFTTESMDNSTASSTGSFYYDYGLTQSMLIEHSAGSYECVHFYKTNSSCSLLFNPVGLWAILENECYLDLPGCGASPLNWAALSGVRYNQTEMLDNYQVYQWIFQANGTGNGDIKAASDDGGMDMEYHEYMETTVNEAQARVPVMFTFKHIRQQSMHFIPSSINYNEPDKKKFEVPANCKKERPSRVEM